MKCRQHVRPVPPPAQWRSRTTCWDPWCWHGAADRAPETAASASGRYSAASNATRPLRPLDQRRQSPRQFCKVALVRGRFLSCTATPRQEGRRRAGHSSPPPLAVQNVISSSSSSRSGFTGSGASSGSTAASAAPASGAAAAAAVSAAPFPAGCCGCSCCSSCSVVAGRCAAVEMQPRPASAAECAPAGRGPSCRERVHRRENNDDLAGPVGRVVAKRAAEGPVVGFVQHQPPFVVGEPARRASFPPCRRPVRTPRR